MQRGHYSLNPLDKEKELRLLAGLIEAFDKIGITVQFAKLTFEDVRGKGGMARVHDRKILILDKDLSTREMTELLASELANMNIENLFLPPMVREAVERYARKNV